MRLTRSSRVMLVLIGTEIPGLLRVSNNISCFTLPALRRHANLG